MIMSSVNCTSAINGQDDSAPSSPSSCTKARPERKQDTLDLGPVGSLVLEGVPSSKRVFRRLDGNSTGRDPIDR